MLFFLCALFVYFMLYVFPDFIGGIIAEYDINKTEREKSLKSEQEKIQYILHHNYENKEEQYTALMNIIKDNHYSKPIKRYIKKQGISLQECYKHK